MTQLIVKRMWWLTVMAAIIAICGLGIYMGIDNIRQAGQQLESIQQANARIDRENRALYSTIQTLKQDRTALENLCRSELGLVRADEIVYLKP